LELGWALWSSKLREAKLRLHRRLTASTNPITQGLLEADRSAEGSWSQTALQELQLWTGGVAPQTDSDWQHAFERCAQELATDDAEELWLACERHPQLHHYRPGPWCMERRAAINAFLHIKLEPSQGSRQLARWLCGGQGLRGGDTNQSHGCSLRTACLPCLARGRKRREFLARVLLCCPEYTEIREQPEFAPAPPTRSPTVSACIATSGAGNPLERLDDFC
jgi:hypothetical protein